MALRAAGIAAGGERGVELLREAVVELGRSGGRLEHARALVDLGAMLRRGGQRAGAREPLAQGMDLAHRCGASALTTRAREELRLAGARPRRLALSGRDALTASELRVVDLARQGMSNKQIAQALFISEHTVETHLRRIFAKLGVSSRAAMVAVLLEAESLAPPPTGTD
jgi:DNA-binding CsgD family transcriptional regulator